MKAAITQPQVNLSLTWEEAQWLMTMVQNPLVEQESPKDVEIRSAFWDALLNAGVSPF